MYTFVVFCFIHRYKRLNIELKCLEFIATIQIVYIKNNEMMVFVDRNDYKKLRFGKLMFLRITFEPPTLTIRTGKHICRRRKVLSAVYEMCVFLVTERINFMPKLAVICKLKSS